jgi:transcriptional antiterminator RfaH
MLPSLEDYKWYPLYTKSRTEKKISSALNQKGIETYLPLNKQLKQWSDRKKWTEEPLFKSYIFVKISGLEYNSVIQTPGVVRFIYFSGRLATIPEKQIEQLKKILEQDYQPEVCFTKLEKGQTVKIIDGSLKGYEGEMLWGNRYS